MNRLDFFGVYYFLEIVGIDEGIKALRVMLCEHFYGGFEFFVQGRYENFRPVFFIRGQMDLIGVQSETFHERSFGLALSQPVTMLEIRKKYSSVAAIQWIDREGQANARQMDPDLMGSAGYGADE